MNHAQQQSKKGDRKHDGDNEHESVARCLGTRRITFHAGKGDGMVAIFRPAPDANDRLQVVVTDGSRVCEQVLAIDEVKMKMLDTLPDDQTKTQALAGYLLGTSNSLDNDGEDAGVIAEYYHGEATHMEMEIRYRLKTNEEVMVKKSWKGRLEQQNHRRSSTAMLAFCNALGVGVNQLQHNQMKLQATIDDLREGRQRWKHTAEQLEGKWQTEKDGLLQNFLTLYNKVRAELDTAREELQTLRSQPKLPQRNVAAAQLDFDNNEEPHREVNQGPDDHDENLYPDDLVEKLAAGPVPPAKRPRWDKIDHDANKKKRKVRAKSAPLGDNGSGSDSTKDDPPTQPLKPLNSAKKKPWVKSAPLRDNDSDSDSTTDDHPTPPHKLSKKKASAKPGGNVSDGDSTTDDPPTPQQRLSKVKNEPSYLSDDNDCAARRQKEIRDRLKKVDSDDSDW